MGKGRRTDGVGWKLRDVDWAMLTGPALAIRTYRERVAPMGLTPSDVVELGVDCAISWLGPTAVDGQRRGSEATVQAMSGLMHLHGRDRGGPRRLGLEVASVAAGVLAAQGVLAGLVARKRGLPPLTVGTSVLQAGLLLTSHYVAAATCLEEWVPAPPGPEPGPPFRSADDKWFEIETLDPEAWKEFWTGLGLETVAVGRAWSLFRPRYFRGTTSLPAGFHEATAGHTLGELVERAARSGVSLCHVRSYGEVLQGPSWSDGHPVLRPLLPASPDASRSGEKRRARHAGSDFPPLPLAGLKVVEATNRMQGPLAGLLLQMLGATVIRIDPPGGDFIRTVPPLAGDTGSFFACFNRGKEAVEMDLTRSSARAELVELVADRDIFVHNWRPGKACEWGLEADDLARHNPDLVYVAASGWGPEAEAPKLVGTDFLVQAYTGAGHGLNPEREPPFPSRVLLVDFMGALVTCEGALRGLYRRELGAGGCRVDTSLLAGGLALQAHVLADLAAGSEEGRHQGRPVWSALDHPLETSDGFLVVSLSDAAALRRLGEVCDVDPSAHDDATTERLIIDRIGAASAAKWEEVMVDAEIACATVCTELATLPSDPRFAHLFEPIGGAASAPISPWLFTG